MTWLLWIAVLASLALTSRVSLRLLNEGMFHHRQGRLVLDVGIPVNAVLSAVFAGIALWALIPHVPRPLPDAVAFPIAILASSCAMSVVILCTFFLSYADPRSPMSSDYRAGRARRR